MFLCIPPAGDAKDELLRKQRELQDMDEFDMNNTRAQRLVEWMEKRAMSDVRVGQDAIQRLQAATESYKEANCRSHEEASETMMSLAQTQELLIRVRKEIRRLQISIAAIANSSGVAAHAGVKERVVLRWLYDEERSISKQVTALRQSLAKIDAMLINTRKCQQKAERDLSEREIHLIHLWGPVETSRVAGHILQADATWNKTRRQKKVQELARFGGWVTNLQGKLNIYTRP